MSVDITTKEVFMIGLAWAISQQLVSFATGFVLGIMKVITLSKVEKEQ